MGISMQHAVPRESTLISDGRQKPHWKPATPNKTTKTVSKTNFKL
jgi:hypothetical protein